VHLVGFTIEIYYDARSYKRQVIHEFDFCTTVAINNFGCDVVSNGKFYIPENSVLQQFQKL